MGMTEREILELPVTIDLMTSARALGISRNEAYALARAGKYPVRTYKVGARYRVVRNDLTAFLGIAVPTAAPTIAAAPSIPRPRPSADDGDAKWDAA
jgi:hypothetical protein